MTNLALQGFILNFRYNRKILYVWLYALVWLLQKTFIYRTKLLKDNDHQSRQKWWLTSCGVDCIGWKLLMRMGRYGAVGKSGREGEGYSWGK
jgi:hypothetical protein